MSAKFSFQVPRTPRNSSTQISPRINLKEDEVEIAKDKSVTDEIMKKLKSMKC